MAATVAFSVGMGFGELSATVAVAAGQSPSRASAAGSVVPGSGTSTGTGGAVAAVDLCTGLIQDKAAHPMTAVAKPALGQVAVDAEFGTSMRRIRAQIAARELDLVGGTRGLEFLYNLNRLNVATSRAMTIAVVVGSPELMRARCRTPRQMQLINALCLFESLTSQAREFETHQEPDQ